MVLEDMSNYHLCTLQQNKYHKREALISSSIWDFVPKREGWGGPN